MEYDSVEREFVPFQSYMLLPTEIATVRYRELQHDDQASAMCGDPPPSRTHSARHAVIPPLPQAQVRSHA